MPCYMCEVEAATREHVPPRAFFPRGFRTNLWTVPSCETHNLDNSLDVEYVRNVIVSHRSVTGTAQELAQSVSFRSFERSSALFFQTFQGAQIVLVNGEPAATFPFDLDRFKRVMKAIASALLYREQGHRYDGDWELFSPILIGANDIAGVPDNWQTFRDLMSTIPFTLRAAPEPSVFRYGIHDFEDGEHFAYALEFYGGFHVYVWTQN